MRKLSKTQQAVNRNLKRVYEDIAQEREHICEGCGTTQNLTHAHLIRRSWRRDLVTDKRNIVYLCVYCHKAYDDNPTQRIYLDNYNNWMEYIKETDEIYYNKMINNG